MRLERPGIEPRAERCIRSSVDTIEAPQLFSIPQFDSPDKKEVLIIRRLMLRNGETGFVCHAPSISAFGDPLLDKRYSKGIVEVEYFRTSNERWRRALGVRSLCRRDRRDSAGGAYRHAG